MSTATPQERVRASIALTVTPEMAERLLQHDKANPSFTLEDLLDDDERAIYLAEIMELFSPERRAERTIRFNTLRGYTHAKTEDEQQTIDKQAREDIAKYGARTDVPRFGTIRPGFCYVCRERVLTDRAVLMITENLQGEAHGLCLAKDEDRFELRADFVYRVREGRQ